MFPELLPNKYNGQINILLDRDDISWALNHPKDKAPIGYLPMGLANTANRERSIKGLKPLKVGVYTWSVSGYKLKRAYHPRPIPPLDS